MNPTDQERHIYWSVKTIETFLEAYKKHRCLWDFEDQDYVSKPARQEALQSILDEIAIPGMDLKQLKRKIHSIRNTYTNERRKIEQSKITALRPEHVYKPRSQWFYIVDKFLRKTVVSRKDRKSYCASGPFTAHVTAVDLQSLLELNGSVVPPDSLEEHDATLSGESVYSSENSHDRSASHYELALSDNFSDSHPSSSGSLPCHQTRRTVAPASIMRNVESTIPEVQCKQETPEVETLEEPRHDQTTEMSSFQNGEEDELDAFARSVLLQMRRLPEEYTVELMAEIQRIISNKRKEYLSSKK